MGVCESRCHPAVRTDKFLKLRTPAHFLSVKQITHSAFDEEMTSTCTLANHKPNVQIKEPSVHNEDLYKVWNKSNYNNDELFVPVDYDKIFKKN